MAQIWVLYKGALHASSYAALPRILFLRYNSLMFIAFTKLCSKSYLCNILYSKIEKKSTLLVSLRASFIFCRSL